MVTLISLMINLVTLRYSWKRWREINHEFPPGSNAHLIARSLLRKEIVFVIIQLHLLCLAVYSIFHLAIYGAANIWTYLLFSSSRAIISAMIAIVLLLSMRDHKLIRRKL